MPLPLRVETVWDMEGKPTSRKPSGAAAGAEKQRRRDTCRAWGRCTAYVGTSHVPCSALVPAREPVLHLHQLLLSPPGKAEACKCFTAGLNGSIPGSPVLARAHPALSFGCQRSLCPCLPAPAGHGAPHAALPVKLGPCPGQTSSQCPSGHCIPVPASQMEKLRQGVRQASSRERQPGSDATDPSHVCARTRADPGIYKSQCAHTSTPKHACTHLQVHMPIAEGDQAHACTLAQIHMCRSMHIHAGVCSRGQRPFPAAGQRLLQN